MRASVEVDNVRIAEVVATLSYAADLGLGQPMAHCMRQTVVALRMAELVRASDREMEATYYLGLMMNVYCHADAAEQAHWFGDDIGMKADLFETLEMSTVRTISFILRRLEFDRDIAIEDEPFATGRDAVDFLATSFGPLVLLRSHLEARGVWPDVRQKLEAVYDRHEPGEYLVVLGRRGEAHGVL